MNVIGLVLALAGAALAIGFADRSRSWDTTCYEVNICDSLTFTVVAELLNEGRTPYSEATRREHISRTRLHGESPPFDLPFQYSPNALPLDGSIVSIPNNSDFHHGLLVVIGAQREERYDYWQLNRRIMRNGGRDLHVRPGVGISPLRRSPSLWSPAKDG